MRDTALIDDLVKKTPDDPFYTPPDPLPGDKPGDPVYLRRLENAFSVPDGGEKWLVLYRSETAGTEPTPAATSGIIVLPDRSKHPVPNDGYPLISWCHGTVGIANRVAPSRDGGNTGASPMNAYPKKLLSRFLDEGWAVAMTDYEALGTGTDDKLHPFMLGQSEARAALDIVLAARHLFGDEISDQFALVGHSQGGQAALFAAANAPGRVEELVAVAAIAPANHPLDVVQAGVLNVFAPDEGYAFTPLFLAGAIGGSIADAATDETIKIIDPEQVLSVEAYKLWPQVWTKSRAELSERTSFGGLKGNEQFLTGPRINPNDDQAEFNRQLEKMNPDLDISVPVRITQAIADQRVKYELPPILGRPTRGTKVLIEELQAHDTNNITTEIYGTDKVSDEEKPLGAHFTTINVDTEALIAWLTERFVAS